MTRTTTRCWTINSREKGIDGFAFVSAPVPSLGDHDVLVRMRAASLNYRDLVIAEGKHKAHGAA